MANLNRTDPGAEIVRLYDPGASKRQKSPSAAVVTVCLIPDTVMVAFGIGLPAELLTNPWTPLFTCQTELSF